MQRAINISFHLEPAGGPFHDPALLVTPTNWRESILFDCGTLHSLKTRDLLRIKWLFLSHLHIDHLIGFDHLLRVRLFSDLPLYVLGPPGTGETIGHRLQGYTWNLTSGSPFEIVTIDLPGRPPGTPSTILYRCHNRFHPEKAQRPVWASADRIDLGDGITVAWHPVDHGVPCYCYRTDKIVPPKFSLENARRLGLEPGPWVKKLVDGERVKQAVQGVERDQDWLAPRLLATRPPQRLGYLTDTRLSRELFARLTAFFEKADVLVSETAYLEGEAELAHQNLHMTTRQVAELAVACGAGALLIFHLSRRHSAMGPEQHLREVRSLFLNSGLLSRCSSETLP